MKTGRETIAKMGLFILQYNRENHTYELRLFTRPYDEPVVKIFAEHADITARDFREMADKMVAHRDAGYPEE